MATVNLEPEKIDTSRKWYVMTAVAFGVFMAVLDSSIVNITLPVLERDLNTHFAVVQWVVLSYLLITTTLLLSIGRLADMFGKKNIYVGGFGIFLLGSLLCGFSTTVGMLIASRVVQAIGGAMMVALGAAILTEAFPRSERGKALGISGLMVSLGGISGPTVGGLILGSFSWQWVFWVNIPIGLVAIVLAWKFVPQSQKTGGQKFDLPGAVMLFFTLLLFLLALTFGQTQGFTHPGVLAMFGVSAALLVFFIRLEAHTLQPVIDLTMFRNRLFSVNLITGFATFIASAGVIVLLPFFLQNVLHLDPRTSGLLLAATPIAMGISAPLAGSLSDRFGSRPLTVIGLGVLVAAYILATTIDESVSNLGYFLRILPIGIGMGLFQSPNNSAVMGSVPRERLGVASSLLSNTRTLGQTTGIAILGALWTSRVMVHAGGMPGTDATQAPVAAQVAGLHDTLTVIIVMISLAFLLSLSALRQERLAVGEKSTQETGAEPLA